MDAFPQAIGEGNNRVKATTEHKALLGTVRVAVQQGGEVLKEDSGLDFLAHSGEIASVYVTCPRAVRTMKQAVFVEHHILTKTEEGVAIVERALASRAKYVARNELQRAAEKDGGDELYWAVLEGKRGSEIKQSHVRRAASIRRTELDSERRNRRQREKRRHSPSFRNKYDYGSDSPQFKNKLRKANPHYAHDSHHNGQRDWHDHGSEKYVRPETQGTPSSHGNGRPQPSSGLGKWNEDLSDDYDLLSHDDDAADAATESYNNHDNRSRTSTQIHEFGEGGDKVDDAQQTAQDGIKSGGRQHDEEQSDKPHEKRQSGRNGDDPPKVHVTSSLDSPRPADHHVGNGDATRPATTTDEERLQQADLATSVQSLPVHHLVNATTMYATKSKAQSSDPAKTAVAKTAVRLAQVTTQLTRTYHR